MAAPSLGKPWSKRLAHHVHRAKEAMNAGYAATQAALPGLEHWLRR